MHTLVTHRYLNLPVQNGAAKRRLHVAVDGRPFDDFEIELASAEPDFWVFLDLTGRLGQTLEVTGDGGDEALAAALQADTIVGAERLYQEPLRQQFHFSARRGWTNDPNGLYYADGRYHLFYQHNPYGWQWGNMHWGHAVSRDLVRWQERQEALYPDALGTMFSGCALVDWQNSAGFQAGDAPAQVLVYTAAGGTSAASEGRPSVQCLAYSNDSGQTWTKYSANPVLGEIASGNRDPKVIWHARSERWVMALYLDANDFALCSSPDLQHWTRTCDLTIPGCRECPDFFPLFIDGDPQRECWVFWGADGSYLVGQFDGKTFLPDSEVLHAYAGMHSYAAQTWSDMPDGRRVQIGWARVATTGMPFNQSMTFPCELTLRSTTEGIRLFSEPVREITTLHEHTRTWSNQTVTGDSTLLSGISGDLFDLRAEFALADATAFGVMVRGVSVTYEVQQQLLTCQGVSALLQPIGGVIRLRLLIDRTSLESFGNDGRLTMPLGVRFEETAHPPLALFAHGGAVEMRSLAVSTLRSIWR